MPRSKEHTDGHSTDALDAALAVLNEPLPRPSAFVSYDIRRCMLLVGPTAPVCEIAKKLRHNFNVVAAIDGPWPQTRLVGVRIVNARRVSVSGYLGRFTATGTDDDGKTVDLAGRSSNDDGCFDLVIDLSPTPLLDQALPPLGYLRLADTGEFEVALDNLLALSGDVRKPKYFHFAPEHCVHRRQQVPGCDRCLDVCPTGAISSGELTVKVDPYLCRGCGSCSAVCPTGALTYSDPPTEKIIDRLARALRAYFSAGGIDPWIGFHAADREPMMHWAAARSITILPFFVHSVTALGIEAWLAALGFGAAGVAVLVPEGTPQMTFDALSKQADLAGKILVGLGRPSAGVQLLRGYAEEENSDVAIPPAVRINGAWSYPLTDPDPRTRLLAIFDHISSQIHEFPGVENVALQSWATFGCVEVEHDLCTMCLACSNLCPTGALRATHDGSELGFIEAKCVQCGACENGCPEKAIKRLPRFDYQAIRDKGTSTLNRVEMANCAQCGNPFMPVILLDSVLNHLTGEGAAVRDAKAMLRVCPQCRADTALRAQFPSVPRSSS